MIAMKVNGGAGAVKARHLILAGLLVLLRHPLLWATLLTGVVLIKGGDPSNLVYAPLALLACALAIRRFALQHRRKEAACSS